MGNLVKQSVLFRDMGWMEYQQAWDYQEALLKENVAVKAALRALKAGTNGAATRTNGVNGFATQEKSGASGQHEGINQVPCVTSDPKDGISTENNAINGPAMVINQGNEVINHPSIVPEHAISGTITPKLSTNNPSFDNYRGTIVPVDTVLDQDSPDVPKNNPDITTVNPDFPIVGADIPLPDTKNYLLFVEHPPVYTLGKSGSIENVLISEEDRLAKGISFYHTNRGGDITFHGPEQIVGYPILDLEKFYTDLGKYLRNLEEVIIATMADYGLKGERSPGETGVWMDAAIPGKERKICAMGIRCSRWVTMHGFAFNVNTDLTYFDHIIPCGIQNKQVTSMESELGRKLNLDEVKEKVKANFEKVFNVELINHH